MSESQSIEAKIDPVYYRRGIEPIDFIESNDLGFHEGTVIKYLTRWKEKHPEDPLTDLLKAQWFLNRLIERVKNGQQI